MQCKRIAIALIAGAASLGSTSAATLALDATPTITYSCDDIAAHSAGTPDATMGDMAGMDRTAMDMDIDQMYVDMMIPHHASIMAMAEAALPRLTDARLQEIARAIIATQGPEIEQLRAYREDWYGGALPMEMDGAMLETMTAMMPGMAGTMEEMAFQMDAAAQVAAVCAAPNADLAFIDLTIPHHQMAIDASEAVMTDAVHPEIRELAQRVIDAQKREIEELSAIRQEIAGDATPTP